MPSSPAETGRANRKTVLALKARAALYAASPLFNPTDNRELWYRAAKANKEILDDSNGFAEKAKLLVRIIHHFGARTITMTLLMN